MVWAKQGVTVKPLICTKVMLRCQVDLRDFVFVLVYQVHLSKVRDCQSTSLEVSRRGRQQFNCIYLHW
jgi:hypothetical protein